MASNFYNFAREEISSVPTFKDLDSHNEKITIERRHKSWKKHIDHMTLRVKVAGTSFLARGARHSCVTRERQIIKTNMAASGFFRARLLLSCFKRNSRISETVPTSTTLVNSLCPR